MSEYATIFRRAREAGLGTTIHTGETKETNSQGIETVLAQLHPDRIGHGIMARYSAQTMSLLRDTGTILEICPSSNLSTGAVSSKEDLRAAIDMFIEYEVPFTINTDGPYLLNTNIQDELNLLIDLGGLFTQEKALEVQSLAKSVSFIS